MRVAPLLVVGLVLSGCMATHVFAPADAPHYDAISASEVKVLDAPPEGSVYLGEVEGVGGAALMIFTPDEISNAKDGAAQLGGDVLVIEGRGSEPFKGDLLRREFPTVRAKVYRSRP